MCMRYVGLVLIALWTSGLPAQSAAAASAVSVESAGDRIELRVTAQISLSDVITRFCQSTHTQCEGINNTQGIMVAPILVRGSRNEVISSLLDGTHLGYLATQPSSSDKQGMLLIQAPTVAVGPTVTAASILSVSEPGATPLSPAGSLQPENTSSNEQPNGDQQNGVAPATWNTGVAANAGASFASTTGTAGSPLTSVVEPGDPTLSGMPFPDSHGNIIPVRHEPEQYLPFPDSQGRPIAANPNAPQVSPFPVEAIRQANGQNPNH